MAKLNVSQMRRDIDSEVNRAKEAEQSITGRVERVSETVSSINRVVETNTANIASVNEIATTASTTANESKSKADSINAKFDNGSLKVENGGTGSTSIAEIIALLGLSSGAFDDLSLKTEGNWEYIKLESGLAICMTTKSANNVSVNRSWGSDYYSNAQAIGNYPTSIAFINNPRVFHSCSVKDGSAWCVPLQGTASKTKPWDFYLYAPASTTTGYSIDVLAIGKWK